MRPQSPFAYHSLRLASDRRWASAYRNGRSAAVARFGWGYGDADQDLVDAEVSETATDVDGVSAPVDLSLWRPPRRRENTWQG